MFEFAQLSYKDKVDNETLAFISRPENSLALKPAVLMPGYLVSERLGENKKVESFVSILRNCFPESKESQKLLVKNEYHDKHRKLIG